jgi:FkbM family methyltransferase
MRLRKLYKLFNPAYVVERSAKEIAIRRLRRRFKGTPASRLPWGLLGTAELSFALQNKDIKTVFDIGANVGNWTILAKSVFPKTRIDAFEPVPSSLDLLKNAVQYLQDVHIHPVALGSKKSQTSMKILGNQADCSSLLDPSAPGLNVEKEIMVSVNRLDDIIVELHIPYPDFIKMDVQGYELEVLKGGVECLKHAKAVQCEVSFEEFYKGQALFRDVLDFMDDHGFRLSMFANYDSAKPFGQPDALFIKIV